MRVVISQEKGRPKGRAAAAAEHSEADMDALDRAFAAARAESAGRSWQLDEMLRDRDWIEVARFAAYCAQAAALDLAPHERPPWRGDPAGLHPEDVLLRRLLKAGLSRYESDPALLKAHRRPAPRG